MKLDLNAGLKSNLKVAASRLAKAQGKLLARSEPLLKQIRHYAEVQGKELQKQLRGSKDVKRVLNAVQKRRKDVEKLARHLPKEVKVVRSYLETQVKELEKLANNLVKNAAKAKSAGAAKTSTRKAATTKKRTAKKAR